MALDNIGLVANKMQPRQKGQVRISDGFRCKFGNKNTVSDS